MIGSRAPDSAARPPAAPGSVRAPHWKPDWVLLGICVLASLPSIYFALHQFLEYDGYWHVFIAQQDNWQNFWFEYHENDHPVLFYLLLKAVMKLGRNVFLYRSISLASDLGSIWLIAAIARKLSLSRYTPYLAALGFAFSIATLELSFAVRSYMLSIFFVLLGFYYFLDLLPGETPQRRGRSRVLFTLALLLAISSHYFAFFFVAACLAALLVYGALSWRSLRWKTWTANLLAFVPVAWLMRFYYHTHIRLHKVNDNQFIDFSFHGHESKLELLTRQMQNAYNLLSPWPVAGRSYFLVGFGIFVLAGAAVVILARARAALPVLMLAALIGELAWGGLHGKYPFGGFLRQQYILFPFLILTGAMYADWLLVRFRTRGWAAAVAALLALSVLLPFVYRFRMYPLIPEEIATDEMRRFEAAIPGARVVLMDEFSLILFFIHHHQWKWTFTGDFSTPDHLDQYALDRGASHLSVVRDRELWTFDLSDPMMFRDVAGVLRASKLDSVAVFYIHQGAGTMSGEQLEAFRQKTRALAEAEHLEVRKLVPDGLNVYAEFATAARP